MRALKLTLADLNDAPEDAAAVERAVRDAIDDIAETTAVGAPISGLIPAQALAMLSFALARLDGRACNDAPDQSWYVVKRGEDCALDVIDFSRFVRDHTVTLVGGEVRSYHAAIALRALLARDAAERRVAHYGIEAKQSVMTVVDLDAPPHASARPAPRVSRRTGAFANRNLAVAAASTYYCDSKNVSFVCVNPASLRQAKHVTDFERRCRAARTLRRLCEAPLGEWREPFAATFGVIAAKLEKDDRNE